MNKQVEDLPEAREFQLERVLSIMTSLVAASGKDTQAVSDTGSTELFEQVRFCTKVIRRGSSTSTFTLNQYEVDIWCRDPEQKLPAYISPRYKVKLIAYFNYIQFL